MADLFSVQKEDVVARACSTWAIRRAVVIVERTLKQLGVRWTALLRDKIAANLELAGCVKQGRIAHDKIREAAILILNLIPQQQRPPDLNVVAVERAVNRVRENAVGWGGIAGIDAGLLGRVKYHQLAGLVLDEWERRRITRKATKGEGELKAAAAGVEEVRCLEGQIAALEAEKRGLLERVQAGGKLVQGIKEIMEATSRTADLNGFLHEVVERAYRAVGCDRAIIFMYDRERNALVAQKHPRGNPYAGKNQGKIADIEAFLEGELVVPLDAAGQRELSHRLLKRALSLGVSRKPGSETARRLLKNLPMLIGGYRSEGRELAGREAELSAEYEIQERFMRANLEALEYGFNLDYEGVGEDKKVVLSKNIVGADRQVQRVILEEFSLLDLQSAPELSRIREQNLPAATEILGSEALTEMLLGTAVFRRFFNRSGGGKKIVPVRGTVPSEAVWQQIWETSESIISLTFKTARSYRVNVDNPQVKINPALIAMWGTTAFATAPIIVRTLVQKGGKTVEEEEVIGMLGLDNDVSRTEFTDEAMSALQSLADIVALQYRLFKHRASLEDVIRKVFKEEVGEQLQRSLREGVAHCLDTGPAKGVLMYAGVCNRYSGDSSRPLFERPQPERDDGNLDRFLVGFKQAVTDVAALHGGVFAGGDQRSAYLFWGGPEKEVLSLAGFAGRALEAAFDLGTKIEALKREHHPKPPAFVCMGMEANTIQTGVVTIDGQPTVMVKGERVKRVVEVAERGGGIMVSPEVIEGLDETWQLALLDSAVKGVGVNFPRAHLARRFVNDQREQVAALLDSVMAPYIRALDELASTVLAGDKKGREGYDCRKENGKRLLVGVILGLMYDNGDFSAPLFLSAEKAGDIYVQIAERAKETLFREARLLISADYALLGSLLEGMVGLVSVAITGEGKSPHQVLQSAQAILSSVLERRPEMTGKKALKDNPAMVALTEDFIREVLSDLEAYEGAVSGGSALVAEQEQRVAAAKSLISDFREKLWKIWHERRLNILYAEDSGFELEGRHWEVWEAVVAAVNEVWQLWNREGGKAFEEFFIGHIARHVEGRGMAGRRIFDPVRVVGTAHLEPCQQVTEGVRQVDDQKGFLRPLLDRKTGGIIGYGVAYSLSPHDAAFGPLAKGVCDLLALRYLERVSV